MIQHSFDRRWWLVAALAGLMAAGCGDGHAKRVPLSGRVLIDGQPLERGFIQVVPSNERPATAELGPDGSFQLSTYTENDGCVLGNHKVSVIANESLGPNALKWYAPKKYADVTSSGLTLEVSEARDDVEINLTWDGKQSFIERFADEGVQPPAQ